MANNGQAIPPVKLTFNPAAEGGQPYLIIESNPNTTDISVKSVLLTAYALDTPEIVLETKEIPANATTKFILPNRGKKDILGIKVESLHGTDKTIIAEYRALYMPGKKLVHYRGTKALKRPPDFKKFWDKARAQLAAVPMEPEIIPMPERESKTGKCYRVKLNSYGGIPIVCYYFVPKEVDPLFPTPSKKKYPAIQIMPGWGAEELPNDRTAQGLITLALNPRTHGPSKQYFKTPIDQHHLWKIDEPEEYYYRQAYMDCLRGIDFLVSRPEVAQDRIGVQGGSQGGAFAIAVAALSPHKIAEVVSKQGVSPLRKQGST
ncbi:MAG: acetylxylan esterase, partial [bacterium]|nr:acetylxylan esterase [bacterium]